MRFHVNRSRATAPAWVDAGHTGLCPRASCSCILADGECTNIHPVGPITGLTYYRVHPVGPIERRLPPPDGVEWPMFGLIASYEQPSEEREAYAVALGEPTGPVADRRAILLTIGAICVHTAWLAFLRIRARNSDGRQGKRSSGIRPALTPRARHRAASDWAQRRKLPPLTVSDVRASFLATVLNCGDGEMSAIADSARTAADYAADVQVPQQGLHASPTAVPRPWTRRVRSHAAGSAARRDFSWRRGRSGKCADAIPECCEAARRGWWTHIKEGANELSDAESREATAIFFVIATAHGVRLREVPTPPAATEFRHDVLRNTHDTRGTKVIVHAASRGRHNLNLDGNMPIAHGVTGGMLDELGEIIDDARTSDMDVSRHVFGIARRLGAVRPTAKTAKAIVAAFILLARPWRFSNYGHATAVSSAYGVPLRAIMQWKAKLLDALRAEASEAHPAQDEASTPAKTEAGLRERHDSTHGAYPVPSTKQPASRSANDAAPPLPTASAAGSIIAIKDIRSLGRCRARPRASTRAPTDPLSEPLAPRVGNWTWEAGMRERHDATHGAYPVPSTEQPASRGANEAAAADTVAKLLDALRAEASAAQPARVEASTRAETVAGQRERHDSPHGARPVPSTVQSLDGSRPIAHGITDGMLNELGNVIDDDRTDDMDVSRHALHIARRLGAIAPTAQTANAIVAAFTLLKRPWRCSHVDDAAVACGVPLRTLCKWRAKLIDALLAEASTEHPAQVAASTRAEAEAVRRERRGAAQGACPTLSTEQPARRGANKDAPPLPTANSAGWYCSSNHVSYHVPYHVSYHASYHANNRGAAGGSASGRDHQPPATPTAPPPDTPPLPPPPSTPPLGMEPEPARPMAGREYNGDEAGDGPPHRMYLGSDLEDEPAGDGGSWEPPPVLRHWTWTPDGAVRGRVYEHRTCADGQRFQTAPAEREYRFRPRIARVVSIDGRTYRLEQPRQSLILLDARARTAGAGSEADADNAATADETAAPNATPQQEAWRPPAGFVLKQPRVETVADALADAIPSAIITIEDVQSLGRSRARPRASTPADSSREPLAPRGGSWAHQSQAVREESHEETRPWRNDARLWAARRRSLNGAHVWRAGDVVRIAKVRGTRTKMAWLNGRIGELVRPMHNNSGATGWLVRFIRNGLSEQPAQVDAPVIQSRLTLLFPCSGVARAIPVRPSLLNREARVQPRDPPRLGDPPHVCPICFEECSEDACGKQRQIDGWGYTDCCIKPIHYACLQQWVRGAVMPRGCPLCRAPRTGPRARRVDSNPPRPLHHGREESGDEDGDGPGSSSAAWTRRCQCAAFCPYVPCPHEPDEDSDFCIFCSPSACLVHRCDCKCPSDSTCVLPPRPPPSRAVSIVCVGPADGNGDPMVRRTIVPEAMLVSELRAHLYELFDGIEEVAAPERVELRLMPSNVIEPVNFRLLFSQTFMHSAIGDFTLEAARIPDGAIVQLHCLDGLPHPDDAEPPAEPPPPSPPASPPPERIDQPPAGRAAAPSLARLRIAGGSSRRNICLVNVEPVAMGCLDSISYSRHVKRSRRLLHSTTAIGPTAAALGDA